MAYPSYAKNESISLKNHPIFNEKWLQNMLEGEPSLLGLGELDVLATEKIQQGAGRLDLLLEDSDNEVRYEVEIQLGTTDPSHIIRTIEYWDLERRRHPKHSHVAVIVAEEITSRFFNVISLFNRAIPIIAIQVQAIEVAGFSTLVFTTILNLSEAGEDEDDQTYETVDRAYWEEKRNKPKLDLVDQILNLVKETIAVDAQLKYNKSTIGVLIDGLHSSWITFVPRAHFVNVAFKLPKSAEIDELLEKYKLLILPYNVKWGRYVVQITTGNINGAQEVLRRLITDAHSMQNGTVGLAD